jgi:hypothetical protein
MTPAEILAELEARNVRVAAVGGRLRVEASPGAAPAWLLAALVEQKAELLALLETGAAETAPAALLASGAGDVPASPPLPVSVSPPLPASPDGTLRIPLDDLVYGDFLARHKLRIVDGTAYPDGRTYRPTIYLAEDDAATR